VIWQVTGILLSKNEGKNWIARSGRAMTQDDAFYLPLLLTRRGRNPFNDNDIYADVFFRRLMAVRKVGDHMKITTNEIFFLQQNSGRNTEKVSKEGFQDILNEEMGNPPVNANTSAALPPMSNLDSIRLDLASQPDTKQILSRMDRFLTLLENYQKQMEDPRITLKETATIVSQMEQQTEDLLPVLETLPEGDGIKDLLNRLLVTSTVETIKFNRGDYL
jgi:hypothetical protein